MSTGDNGDGDEVAAVVEKVEEVKANLSPLEAQILLAKRGRREVLPLLRQSLDAQPELSKVYGDLGRRTREVWLSELFGDDLFLKETTARRMDELEAQLAGPSANPLEKLLAENVALGWVRTLYSDALEIRTANNSNPKLEEIRVQRQEAAHRHFLDAVKMLATVRKLLPQTIRLEVVQQPAAQPIIHNAETLDHDAAKRTTAKQVNGVNRVNGKLNGHVNGNRVHHLLNTQDATAEG